MAEKIRLRADRVISRTKGSTKYYADDGSIASIPNKQVKIFDNQEELEQDIEAEQIKAANELSDTEVEHTSGPISGNMAAQIPNDEQADSSEPSAAPATSNKRGKGSKKVKTMATKKASKKKAPARKASNGALIRSVAGREHDISGYEKVRNASGHTSYDSGDSVAVALRGKSLDEVYAHAAKKLKEDEKSLRSKYKHLNPGMQRMSLGNRLRKLANAKAAA